MSDEMMQDAVEQGSVAADANTASQISEVSVSGEYRPEALEANSPDETAPDSQPEQTESKPSRRVDRRIAKVLQRATEAEQSAAYYRALAEQNGLIEAPQPEPVTSGEADIDAIVEQRIAEREAEREYAKEFNAHIARVEASKQRYPDFDQAIQDAVNAGADLHPAVAQAVMNLENSADVLYRLAKDLDLSDRIAAMNPVGAVAEIGKLSAQLGTRHAPPVTQAPPPPTPVKKNSAVTSSGLSDDLSPEEWVRRRNAALRRR
jgi:hypothetical protein